jgi:allantoate deiminase
MEPRTHKILRRIDQLARITDEPGRLTRVYGSPAMRRANALVARWMREAGMSTSTDAIGNLVGRSTSGRRANKIFLMGSHLDTVRNAGKYDGPLGVVLAIACVEELRREKVQLPFDLAILGFADEEGVRYQTTYLGSRVVAGTFAARDLQRRDAEGILLRDAIRDFGGAPEKLRTARWPAENILGYLEAHIEQGPVLEKNSLAVGVVTSISGQSRLMISFTGSAGHAGTTPMALRKDALCAAAELVLAVEAHGRKINGLVATVGRIGAEPGASNVIPGTATLTLDVRHQKDAVRRAAVTHLKKMADQIRRRRGVKVCWQLVQQTASVHCAPDLSRMLEGAVEKYQPRVLSLASGAGHDAAVMSGIAPAAMLFIRCKKGLSHHPAEAVKPGDVTVAGQVMTDFVRQLARRHE